MPGSVVEARLSATALPVVPLKGSDNMGRHSSRALSGIGIIFDSCLFPHVPCDFRLTRVVEAEITPPPYK